jgi:hypothetical protein
MAQTRKRAKNTLDVNSPAKIRMMEALMGKGKSGVVSYVLVYAPWCGACRKFRKNIWDPSMRFSAKHNRIAIRDDVFNNSPFAKKVPDLKYLPSMILVDEKGDVQMNAAPEGPTNILPTPTSVDQLVKMANVNVKPLSYQANAAKQTNQANQADAVNDILSKPTNMNNVIANANKTAQIAKNAAAQVKANTVALNNASRNMLARAIVNTKVAAENARKAAGNAKESANSIRNMLGEIKNIVASAKGSTNTNASTNMAAKAAAAAAVAAAAAEAAEDAANEGTNAVEDANANNMNANANNMNANVNVNNVNAYNTNDEEANTNAVNYEDWEKEELMDMIPDEEYNNASNFSPPDGMMSKNGSLTTKYPTPPVAPQNYKKPSNMVGGKRPSHGNLYKMLVSMNNRTTQRKRHATSKKLTRRTN